MTTFQELLLARLVREALDASYVEEPPYPGLGFTARTPVAPSADSIFRGVAHCREQYTSVSVHESVLDAWPNSH